MKKAIILGSNSYLGLLIEEILKKQGINVQVIGKENKAYQLATSKLGIYSELIALIKAEKPDILINCVGSGVISDYESSLIDIELDLRINTLFPLNIFVPLLEDIDYILNINSVAIALPSPLFASYAASKAYTAKYIETINAENINSSNKAVITDVHLFNFSNSPSFGDGTHANHKTNLARINKTIDAMFMRQTNYFEAPFFEVKKRSEFERIAFIERSQNQKIQRVHKKRIIGYLTGSFDLFHYGHLKLIARAASQVDVLVVGVHNSGAWKGKNFHDTLTIRKQNIKALRYVDRVITTSGEDDQDWENVHYNYLFVGDDYQNSKRFNKYEKTLKNKAKIIYLPRTKNISSTFLRETIKNKTK